MLTGRRDRLLVTVVTGFLGSGKTTLLRRALGETDPAEVAVIVNEFGDVGVDHAVLAGSCACCVLLSGGCACCTRREDLLAALKGLLDEHERDRLPALQHVVVETSGLADPLPILAAIALDPVLRHHFALDEVVAVVDSVHGPEQLQEHPEVARQVQGADRVLVSKTDLAAVAEVEDLQRRLAALNPVAGLERTDSPSPLLFRAGRQARQDRSFEAAAAGPVHHTEPVALMSLTFDESLDWVAFGVWLSLLVHAHGRRLLRVKGILPTADQGLISVNAVQQAIYPPEHVGASTAGEGGRLVVIARDLSAECIARSFRAFQQAA